jgi:hypothetical protein
MSVIGFISIVVLVLYILGSILYAFITRQAHEDHKHHR